MRRNPPARTRLAVILTLLLVAALVPAAPPGFAASDGPLDTLRLYGCVDRLRVGADPVLAAPSATTTGIALDSDGRPDCRGDEVVVPGAWMSGSSSAFHRRALADRDQYIDLTLRHLPAAWFPGPGQGADALASLADPTVGLFDRDVDGRLDYAFASDELHDPTLDDDAVHGSIDVGAEDDMFPDFNASSLDPKSGVDRYFPAIEAQYTWSWWGPDGRAASVPDGGGLIAPFGTDRDDLRGLDSWSLGGRDEELHWVAQPFGLGTQEDGIGALVTRPVQVAVKERIRVFDHSLLVTGIPGDEMQVVVEVRYRGGTVSEILDRNVALSMSVPATMASGGSDATNVLFADRSGVRRSVPATGTRDDDGWFVLLEGVHAGTATATLRFGRIVGASAPWNVMAVDGSLYRVTTVDEQGGALRRFGLAQVIPLGDDAPIETAGVVLTGYAAERPLPFLPPFNVEHLRARLVGGLVSTDAYGFLIGSGSPIGTASLTVLPAARSPGERTTRTGPLAIFWVSRGVESRLHVAAVAGPGDASLIVSSIAPDRFVEMVLSPGDYVVHSELLDDTDVLLAASTASASPRAFRSFVFTPGDAERMFADGRLRLMSGTAARPEAGDLVRADPAVVLWRQGSAEVRTPTGPAHQRIAIAFTYDAFHAFDTGATLVPRFDESVAPTADPDTRLDVVDVTGPDDNLYDVSPANRDRARGDAYGPALLVATRHAFLSRVEMGPLSPVLGEDTRLFLPVADRDARVPGADSSDMDGDGVGDAVRLRGFWDMDGPSGARLRTSGGFADTGEAATSDLLWVQSAPIQLAPGADARFFDHGVRLVENDAQGARFVVQDHGSAGTPRGMGDDEGVSVPEGKCVFVDLDGSLEAPRDCTTLQVSPESPDADPHDRNVVWWMELLGRSGSTATVRLNRVLTDVDRGAAGDQTAIFIGGATYRVTDIVMRTTGAEDRFVALAMEQTVPIGADVMVEARGAERTLSGVPLRGDVALPPPFNGPHDVLQEIGVRLERDVYGHLDSRADPTDDDATLVPPDRRVSASGPLVVSVESRGRVDRSFAFMDPLRRLQPDREGSSLFLNGVHADPLSGLTPRPTAPRPVPAALATSSRGGFPEALRGDERGWDEYVALGLSLGRGSYLVDSPRLGRAAQTATLEDRGPGDAGDRDRTARPGDTLHPNDAGAGRPGRGSGLWRYDASFARDLYVGSWSPSRPEPPVDPPEGNATQGPDPTPDGSPAPSPAPRSGDSPGVAGTIVILTVMAGAVLWRRRH